MPVIGFDEGKNKEEVYKKSEVDTSLETKVDKVEGKGLSTEDYTTEEKAEVAKVTNKQNKHLTANASLLANGWNNKSQTVNVTGVTANNTVLVSAAPSSIEEYGLYGVMCTAQGTGTLTFTCKFTPTSNLLINVVILEV